MFACLNFDSEFLKIFDDSIEPWTRASFVPAPLYEMSTAALQNKRCPVLVIGKRYVPQRVDHRNLKNVAQNMTTMLHVIAKTRTECCKRTTTFFVRLEPFNSVVTLGSGSG